MPPVWPTTASTEAVAPRLGRAVVRGRGGVAQAAEAESSGRGTAQAARWVRRPRPSGGRAAGRRRQSRTTGEGRGRGEEAAAGGGGRRAERRRGRADTADGVAGEAGGAECRSGHPPSTRGEIGEHHD